MLDAAGLRAKISVSKTTFDDITSALLNETIEKTDAAIAIAESKGYKISEILLVGGSTRMPQVTNALTQKYGMEPKKVLDPDEAVATGAAIHAVNVYINNQQSISEWEKKIAAGEPVVGDGNTEPLIENKENYEEELTVDQAVIGIGGKMKEVVVATTKSYALKVLVNGEAQCCNMILKNESMPNGAVTVTRQFGTAGANQDTAELVVFENDFMEEYFAVDDDYILGTATLALPGNLPEGSPIEVTFALNTEGILEISGRDLTSGEEVRATMQAKGVMATDKVDELKEKSKNVIVM